MSEVVKLVIPSYRRAGRVHTLAGIANVTLVVPNEQLDEYKEHYPDTEIVGHPTGKGYAKTAQWVLDKFKNVFFLDDDMKGMYRKYPEAKSGIPQMVTPQTAYDIIQCTASAAKEIGAYLFGFSNVPNPLTYHGFQPYRFTGFVTSGACGILDGGKIWYNDSMVGTVDFFVCLYNAYRNRYCFVDERFCIVDKEKVFANPGGAAGTRNMDSEEEDYNKLRAMFGDAVQIKQQGPLHIRKMTNPWEKTMMLPF